MFAFCDFNPFLGVGKMENKITRRVLLGTAVSALVISPFLFQRFRHKKQLPSEKLNDFARRWETLLSETVPDNVPMKMSEAISCQIKPLPRQIEYTILTPNYYEIPKTTGDVPDVFSCEKGQFTIKAAESGIVIHGENVKTLSMSPIETNIEDDDPWTILVKNGHAVPAKKIGDQVEEIQWQTNPNQFLKFQSYMGFSIDAPSKPITQNETWTIESTSIGGEFIGRVSRECMGLFKVNDRRAVKISTKQNIGYEDVFSYIESILLQVKDKQLRDQINNELETARKMNYRMVSENESFFDTETGMLIFRKFERRLFQNNSVEAETVECSFTRVDV